MKTPRILYFVSGVAPSPADFEAAAAIPGDVVFRNALAVPSEPHCLEICDGVAGDVPAIYAEKYADAETALANHSEALAALASKVGDAPAPKKAAAAKKGQQAPAVPQGGQQAQQPAQQPAAAPAGAGWVANPPQGGQGQ